MSYKTIVVHADESRHSAARIEFAARLATMENAHLIGVAITGVSRFLYAAAGCNMDAPVFIEAQLQAMRKEAENALKTFETLVQGNGVASFESRLVNDDAAGGLSLQARYADLAVVGQYDPEEFSSSIDSDLPEYVIMNSGCPVLVVPHTGSFDRVVEKILIAWNGSMEARRAVRNALPLLKRANIVELAVFNAASQRDAHGAEPGADIGLYLSRHGIHVDVLQQTTEDDIGEALLSLAAGLNVDLLVMGCYGHSRFREILLGGATSTILKSMTVPVMMSH